jgi:transposase
MKSVSRLVAWLALCCELYNAALDERKSAFYRRVEAGQTPGYPRFKSRLRYDSLTFKQSGNSFHLLPGSKKKTGTLVLAKLGQVKMVLHRPIKGTPKTAIVKRTPTGKWFVSISVEMADEEVQAALLPASSEQVGEVCKLIKQFGLLAVEALVVRVNPAYTSQTCSACRHRQPMPLSVRVYECPHCGLIIDRDHNGSNNILEEALIGVGRHTRLIPEAPGL